MAELRTAMDASFWDLNLSTPRTLGGIVKAVPDEPFPVIVSKASPVLRAETLPFLARSFPLRMVPNVFPTDSEEDGSFNLQTALKINPTKDWWVSLLGQVRTKKLISSMKRENVGGQLISSIKEELLSGRELIELPSQLLNFFKPFFDKSLYAIGLCSQFPLTDKSSVVLSTERNDGDKLRHKVIYNHKFPYHDVTLEAAWPELFIDKKGAYWEVPESISLDLASPVNKTGLHYRCGLHKNGGDPRPVTGTSTDVPAPLLSGWCARASFSYEKHMDLWRVRASEGDLKMSEIEKQVLTQLGLYRIRLASCYDVKMREPHAAFSGIIGGTCAAWFSGASRTTSTHVDQSTGDSYTLLHSSSTKRSPFSADLFSSLRATFQHGHFGKDYRDFTRIDAWLDICSASAFAKGAFHLLSDPFRKQNQERNVNTRASPKLNLVFQQQVAGPIVFRVDSRLSANHPETGSHVPHVEDVIYSLNYYARILKSGKVVFWYSPKRKEGMVEVKLMEF